MNSPVFVSFFTSAYVEHAAGLVESLDAFDLAHDVLEVTDKGSWNANCHRKPAFIRAMLHRHRGPVVWIDADARMRQVPTLLIEMAATRHADLAFHTYGLSGGRRETLSGTVYVDDTPAAHALLDAWQSRCSESPGRFDQESLGNAVFESTHEGLRVAALPAEYCFLFDIFRRPFYRNNWPNIGEPVVEHLQHSRVVRQKERDDASAQGASVLREKGGADLGEGSQD